MPVSRDDVISALKGVIDPELYIDIWTLGLVYDIEIVDRTVKITMTFTSIACPLGPQLVEEVKRCLESLDSVDNVEVTVVFKPPWEPSEDLKAILGI
jgi:metal-sulfur cluster biosynthetic enzyme